MRYCYVPSSILTKPPKATALVFEKQTSLAWCHARLAARRPGSESGFVFGFRFWQGFTTCSTPGVFHTGVTHVVTTHHVDHAFSHVLGVVANTLQRTCDKDQVNGVRNRAWIFNHVSDDVTQRTLPLTIHFLVATHNLCCVYGILARKGVQHIVDHASD